MMCRYQTLFICQKDKEGNGLAKPDYYPIVGLGNDVASKTGVESVSRDLDYTLCEVIFLENVHSNRTLSWGETICP